MASDDKPAGVISPKQLNKMAEEKAMAEARVAFERVKKAEQELREAHEAFMTRDLHPQVMERVMTAVRRAAEQGQSELVVLKFSSTLLKDGGRRVNNFEPDWPDSLDGFAKRAYDFYVEHLKPAGYKLRAQILDYPGGVPGDCGMILQW